MNDLISWLRQQLDSDEAKALADTPIQWSASGIADDGAHLIAEGRSGTPGSDYARVLRQVAAQRSILNLCAAAMDAGQIKPGTNWNDDAAGAEVAEATVRHLGEVYQDRPGYREEWRP